MGSFDVIVSGAGRGLGRSIASSFAAEGALVVAFSRTESELASLSEEVKAVGGSLHYIIADATKEEDVQRVVQEAERLCGKAVDVFVANAGAYPYCKLEDMSFAHWNDVISTNLSSAFLAAKFAVLSMKVNGWGRLLLISSISGPETGLPGYAHYTAAKAGLMGFMKTAAVELAKHRITVNAVLPGNIMTEALAALPHGYIEQTVKAIPAGHLGVPADVAHAVLFLASPQAGFITGQGLVVDGGQVLPESHHSEY